MTARPLFTDDETFTCDKCHQNIKLNDDRVMVWFKVTRQPFNIQLTVKHIH